MKTFSKVIYKKQYCTPSICDKTVEGYIKIERHFDFKEGLRYSVSVPNFSCCRRKLINALIYVMGHESIGMRKYEQLKEMVDTHHLWNKIC